MLRHLITVFIATTKETTKEVARPKAAPPLLWWRPTAATFVVAMNRVDVVALNTIFALRLRKTGRTFGRTDSRLDGWSVGRTDERLVGQVGLPNSLLSSSILKRSPTVIRGESLAYFTMFRECVRKTSFEKSSSTHCQHVKSPFLLRSLERSIARSLDRSLARSLDRSIARSIARSLARSLEW